MPGTHDLHPISGEFRLRVEELDFQRPRLRDTALLFRAVLWLASLFYFAFAAWDFQQLGWNEAFEQRAAGRFVVLATGLLLAWSLRRVTEPRDLVWRTLLFIAAVTAGYAPVLATDPPLVFTHVSMFVVVGIIFLASPVSFTITLGFAVSASLAYLLLVWTLLRPDPYLDFGPLALLFLFVNLIGALLLRRFNQLLRRNQVALIAEQKATRAMQESEETMRQLFMAVPVPLLLARLADGRVLKGNSAACSCLGAAAFAEGTTSIDAVFRGGPTLAELARTGSQGGAADAREYQVTCGDGSTRDVLISSAPVSFHGEECLMTGITDISERKRLESTLRHLAITDQLTGLYNRHHFLSVAETELVRARRYERPLSVLMLDIDNFKAVNDTYGHAVGDDVLRNFAALCGEFLREQDLPCRFGGEEFAILLPETSLATAFAVAERLREAASRMRLHGGPAVEFGVTISAGVADALVTDDDIDAALWRADQGLYRAKRAGRNRVEMVRAADAEARG